MNDLDFITFEDDDANWVGFYVRPVGLDIDDACSFISKLSHLGSVAPKSILTVTLHPSRGAIAPVTEVAIQKP